MVNFLKHLFTTLLGILVGGIVCVALKVLLAPKNDSEGTLISQNIYPYRSIQVESENGNYIAMYTIGDIIDSGEQSHERNRLVVSSIASGNINFEMLSYCENCDQIMYLHGGLVWENNVVRFIYYDEMNEGFNFELITNEIF